MPVKRMPGRTLRTMNGASDAQITARSAETSHSWAWRGRKTAREYATRATRECDSSMMYVGARAGLTSGGRAEKVRARQDAAVAVFEGDYPAAVAQSGPVLL